MIWKYVYFQKESGMIYRKTRNESLIWRMVEVAWNVFGRINIAQFQVFRRFED